MVSGYIKNEELNTVCPEEEHFPEHHLLQELCQRQKESPTQAKSGCA